VPLCETCSTSWIVCGSSWQRSHVTVIVAIRMQCSCRHTRRVLLLILHRLPTVALLPSAPPSRRCRGIASPPSAVLLLSRLLSLPCIKYHHSQCPLLVQPLPTSFRHLLHVLPPPPPHRTGHQPVSPYAAALGLTPSIALLTTRPRPVHPVERSIGCTPLGSPRGD
jgi:hypothetical protein